MTISFILSQIFAVLSYLCLITTYSLKKQKIILLFNIFCSISFSLQYFFLQAYTGMLANLITLIFILVCYHYSKNNKDIPLFVLILYFSFLIISATFTWDGPISLLPLFGDLIYGFSAWQKSPLVYKWLNVPLNSFWLSYTALVGSPFGMVGEAITLIMNLVLAIDHTIKERKNKKA